MNIKYIVKKRWRRRFGLKFMPTAFLSAFLVSTVTFLTGLTKHRNLVYITEDTVSGKNSKELYFLGDNVENILDQANVVLNKNDEVNCVKDGKKINIYIKRSHDVGLSLYGKPSEKVSVKPGTTVRDLLTAKGLNCDAKDRNFEVNVDLDKALKTGDDVIVDKVEHVLKDSSTKQTAIPYKVKEEIDSSMPKGQRVVKVKGEEGVKEQYTHEVFVNGLYSGTKNISKVAKLPKQEVVLVGAKEELPPNLVKQQEGKKQVVTKEGPKSLPSRASVFGKGVFGSASKDSDGWSTVHGRGTAYTTIVPGRRTSTGTKPTEGRTIAVNRNVIPYNSLVQVFDKKNNKLIYSGKAEDTGTALTSGKAVVDCFYNTEGECRKFGSKQVTVKFKPPAGAAVAKSGSPAVSNSKKARAALSKRGSARRSSKKKAGLKR